MGWETVRGNERERGAEMNREIFMHWFIFQVPATAGAGLGQSQEPKTQLGSLIWIAKALKPPSAASRDTLAGGWREGE